MKYIKMMIILVMIIASYIFGEMHVIEDSKMFIENNEIIIEIDGNYYVHVKED